MAITECNEHTKETVASDIQAVENTEAEKFAQEPETLPAASSEATKPLNEEPETRNGNTDATSEDGLPYEIIICYKEQTENGNNTRDFFIARELYLRTKNQGWRVFFAAEGLKDTEENKEFYIKKALEQANVMLVVGTSKESFEAKEMKDCWSRFLGLAKIDKSKHLIPCFRKISESELPQELSEIEAVDLNRSGAINNLVLTIGRIFREQEEAAVQEKIAEEPAENQETAKTENPDMETGTGVQVEVMESDKPDEPEERMTPEQMEEEYKNACDIYDYADTPEELGEAAEIFRKLGNYKDSEDLFKECLEFKEVWELEDRSFFEKFSDWRRNSPVLHRMRESRKKLSEKIKANPKLHRCVIAAVFLVIAAVAAEVTLKLIIPEREYRSARQMMDAKDYNGAIAVLETLNGFRDSEDLIGEVPYLQAEDLLASGDNVHAAMTFGRLGDYSDARERSFELWNDIARRRTIACGRAHSVALKTKGTVVAEGLNTLRQCEVKEWTDIIAVSAGGNHTLGLKSDGTVVATGDNGSKQCEVSGWTDIVAIYAGSVHSMGLKSDGTVLAAGTNTAGECNVSEWTDIIGIAGNGSYSLGLKSDGTVVATGSNAEGACNVTGWTDITAIEASERHVVGLRSDGTIAAAGANNFGQCNVSNIGGVSDIAVNPFNTLFLMPNGSVVAVGRKLNIGLWTGIVELAAGFESAERGGHLIGLKANGTMVAVGNNYSYQCRISERKDIMLPYVKENAEDANAKSKAAANGGNG